MAREFFLSGKTCRFIEKKRYTFKVGPLGYEVVYHIDEDGSRSYAHINFLLMRADLEPVDPNLNYSRLNAILNWGVGLGGLHKGYGVSKNTVYAFKTLATLAAIVRDIVATEHPDELRFFFLDTTHASFWKKFIYYIAKSGSGIQSITTGPSRRFHPDGEEWVISLNK